jgi:acetyltransferase
MRLEIATPDAAYAYLPQLVSLLINNVNSGASIGWLPPLEADEAESWWRSRIAEVAAGHRVMLFAWEDEALAGSGQLALEQRTNGNHRAEVQKLMVHTDYRRRGIAEKLMWMLEDCAYQHQRSMLFLDTREGDASERLYQKVGYLRVGAIPDYVRNPDGGLVPTVIYAKVLKPKGDPV